MMGHQQAHHPVIRVQVIISVFHTVTRETILFDMQLDQPIDSLDARPEYSRVTIDWSATSAVPLARIISPGNQCSSRLLSARRCTGLVRLPSKADVDPSFFQRSQADGHGQQVDCLLLSL